MMGETSMPESPGPGLPKAANGEPACYVKGKDQEAPAEPANVSLPNSKHERNCLSVRNLRRNKAGCGKVIRSASRVLRRKESCPMSPDNSSPFLGYGDAL